MKSIVTGKKNETLEPFPKLMICIHTGVIVLMTDECSGTFVGNQNKIYPFKHYSDTWNPFGHYSDTWNINHLIDYIGTVTLSND